MPNRRGDRRAFTRPLGLLIVVLAAALSLAPAALGRNSSGRLEPSSPLTRGSTYLALGDSVTFGYQEPTVVPAPDYSAPATFLGYPLQIGTALHVKAVDPACPGETSGSLINVNTLSNGCENGYRKAYPLHVSYKGSQLAYALSYLRKHSRVRLVSLMIGANDLFLCQKQTSDGCISELKGALAKISVNVRHILSALRNRADYDGQIVIVNYYSLDYSSPLVNSESQALNQAQDSAAKPFHVRIADGYGEFQTASVRFGNKPCLGGLLTQLGTPGTCGVHPSYAGQTLLAKAVITATHLP